MKILKFTQTSLFILTLLLSACSNNNTNTKNLTKLVNPFIGTVGSGNTFLGASLPYGMVQLGPYQKYLDNDSGIIYGFSHTHVSGMAGGGNTTPGNIIFMPLVENNLKHIQKNRIYKSHFLHKNEVASPGYYKVLLDDYNIKAELTSTLRTGFHKYTFPKTENAAVVLKLENGSLTVEGNEISGVNNNKIYFVAKFSKPISAYNLFNNNVVQKNVNTLTSENILGKFMFSVDNDKTILLKVGISTVSVEGARKNLEKELPGWNFEEIKNRAKETWNNELNKIIVEGGTKEQRIIFYTALYHPMMHPNIYMDVDGKYRSTNGKIFVAKDFVNYTNFSLWDTFRALHPLYTIINRERTSDFVKTFLERYDHSGRMLIMEFNGVEGETPPMIAYHSLSVVADAYVKGIRNYNIPKVYEAMKKLANDKKRKGKELYLDYGFIPADLKGQSVSRTLEYSYDDWCITRLAKDFNEEDELYYTQRGNFYKNLFSKEVNFMRGRKSNFEFVSSFDPMETINHYTEANAYQYTTFVPQDIYGLINLMGGDKIFETWLDSCFTVETDYSKINVRDVTGLIGQYAHGNEPSHHIGYLYNYVGTPWKTQKIIRQILTTLYANKQNGIDGNEDCGQMSAWYVMSAMGLYSVTPGLDYYVIGTPLFDKVKINLENGNTFEIIALNNTQENLFIQSAKLNGKPYAKTYLKNSDIMKGGKIVFEMGDKPNKKWGNPKVDRPPFPKEKFKYAKSPQLKFSDIRFLNNRKVKIYSDEKGAKIYYTLNGANPTKKSTLYTKPLTITKTSVLKCRSYVDRIISSYPLTIHFKKIDMLGAVNITGLTNGLKYYFIDQPVENARTVMEYPVTETGIIKDFNVDRVKDQRPFGLQFNGYIKVPKTGVYTFELEANDGAILYINDKLIIDNDGGHRAQKLESKIGLKKGWHPIKVKYFQQGLAKSIDLFWAGPGLKSQKISKNVLYHKK